MRVAFVFVGIAVPGFRFVDHFVLLPFQKADAIPLVRIGYTSVHDACEVLFVKISLLEKKYWGTSE